MGFCPNWRTEHHLFSGSVLSAPCFGPIEPSSIGGERIARASVALVTDATATAQGAHIVARQVDEYLRRIRKKAAASGQ